MLVKEADEWRTTNTQNLDYDIYLPTNAAGANDKNTGLCNAAVILIPEGGAQVGHAWRRKLGGDRCRVTLRKGSHDINDGKKKEESCKEVKGRDGRETTCGTLRGEAR